MSSVCLYRTSGNSYFQKHPHQPPASTAGEERERRAGKYLDCMRYLYFIVDLFCVACMRMLCIPFRVIIFRLSIIRYRIHSEFVMHGNCNWVGYHGDTFSFLVVQCVRLSFQLFIFQPFYISSQFWSFVIVPCWSCIVC